MRPNPQFPATANFDTFTKEILNEWKVSFFLLGTLRKNFWKEKILKFC